MNGTPLAILLAACVAAGCAHSFQPKAVDRVRPGMVVGDVASTLGPPDFITSALRVAGGSVETWQYTVKGKSPSFYCFDFINGRLSGWRHSATPTGQDCAGAVSPAPQPPQGADAHP